MARYVAFLRGMNVGGHRVKSDELRAVVGELGFDDVATFRTSGNVIFDADDSERPGDVADRIEAGLGASLGYEVPVFLRSAAAVRAIAVHEPFEAKLVEASSGKLQVGLLSKKPRAAARRTALALASDEDRLAIRGSE